MFLMPGFAQVSTFSALRLALSCTVSILSYGHATMQMFFFYFMSSRVIRSVHYGKKPRQRLDIFVPKHHWKSNDGLRPVVIYVTGVCSAIVQYFIHITVPCLSDPCCPVSAFSAVYYYANVHFSACMHANNKCRRIAKLNCMCTIVIISP